jgi:hypothetical protein
MSEFYAGAYCTLHATGDWSAAVLPVPVNMRTGDGELQMFFLECSGSHFMGAVGTGGNLEILWGFSSLAS